MADTCYFIEDLINDLRRGRIKIPSFQRGFVWDADRVAYFVDSIYKGFPFGSVLLWRTRTPLRMERNLGPYKLPDNDPEYPIDYVLDGQQRITSIFGIFQNSLEPEENEATNWVNLFFELNSQEAIPFRYLDNPENYDSNKYFPLKYVFDSPKYRQTTRNLDEDLARQIDELVSKLTKAKIPLERFESEERKYVATVFERINRQGLELDTLQLLSVWNWSEDFDLQEKFREILEELEPFGFKEVGSDLLLKCCAAVVKNSADPEVFVNLPGNEVRQKFDEVRNGIFRAIDFLKREFNIFSLKFLPMENILVVLSAFFASPEKQPSPPLQEQYKSINKWFWRSCFSQRYARGGAKSTEVDLKEIQKLKNGESSNLGEFPISIDKSYFLNNVFRVSSIATSTLVLLLAENEPLNFIQGTKISLEEVLSQGNRKEFHHIFPKAYLKGLNSYSDEEINCLVNFSILSRADNNKLKARSPGNYRSEMPTDAQALETIIKSHFCFNEMFNDNYKEFLEKRANLLVGKAQELSQLTN
jgi:hypothetical protein